MACSGITKIELLIGILPEEEQLLSLFLSGFEQIEVSDSIDQAAGVYIRQRRNSHGVNVAGAIIAATAERRGSCS